MKRNIEFLASLADFLHRLNHSDLVINCHNRNEPHIGPNSGLKLIQVDDLVGLHQQVGDFEALLLEVTAGIEDALVLSQGGDDVALLVLVEVQDSLDGDERGREEQIMVLEMPFMVLDDCHSWSFFSLWASELVGEVKR